MENKGQVKKGLKIAAIIAAVMFVPLMLIFGLLVLMDISTFFPFAGEMFWSAVLLLVIIVAAFLAFKRLIGLSATVVLFILGAILLTLGLIREVL